jgi:hypothetical protein
MPLPLVRYEEDPTGINPDNLVVGEIHTLNNRPIRAVSPIYGPYFTENLQIRDNVTNRLLVRNEDYKCVELLQEATLRIGKEVAELIIIINPDVNSDIRLHYQILGGLYQNNTSGIVNMYQNYLNDNRTVNWEDIVNKPIQYPPSLHNHFLNDIYGFEYIVVALERIRNAIILSDVPAFEAVIDYVKEKVLPVATADDINSGLAANKLMTLEMFLYSLDKFNFNGLTLSKDTETVRNNSSLPYLLSSTNLPDDSVLYWTLEHITTQPNDFGLTSGIIRINYNRGRFNIPITNTTINESAEKFKVLIRKNSINGPILLKTNVITIVEKLVKVPSTNVLIDYFTHCSILDPDIDVNPYNLFIMEYNKCHVDL